MLAIATQLKLQEFQLDVKSALLNGELQEEAYVKQPQWYVIKGQVRHGVQIEDNTIWPKTNTYNME